MPSTSLKPKLTKAQIDALVAEKEAELHQELARDKAEKSLRAMIRRLEKQGLFINTKSFAHMEKDEDKRWVVSTCRRTP